MHGRRRLAYNIGRVVVVCLQVWLQHERGVCRSERRGRWCINNRASTGPATCHLAVCVHADPTRSRQRNLTVSLWTRDRPQDVHTHIHIQRETESQPHLYCPRSSATCIYLSLTCTHIKLMRIASSVISLRIVGFLEPHRTGVADIPIPKYLHVCMMNIISVFSHKNLLKSLSKYDSEKS